MSARTHNFRIGLFVLIGAVLFIGGLFAMGLRSYFGQSDVFETVLRGQVDNLTSGALVKLRGVTIGKVRSIEFAGAEYPEFKSRYVVIQFEVPRNFEWGASGDSLQPMLDTEAAKGLRARVESQGFLGANYVGLEYVDPVLYPVEPIPFKPRHYYIPSAQNQFNRLLVSLDKTLRHVEDVDAGQLVDKAQKLIDAADRLVANINQIDFNQLGTNATGLIAEFRETNRGLQATLSDARGAVGDARAAISNIDLPELSRNTTALEAKFSGDAMEIRRLLSSVDTGELNGALANVRNATDELIVLLHQLSQQPSAVIFSKPPKPVNEMEAPPKQ